MIDLIQNVIYNYVANFLLFQKHWCHFWWIACARRYKRHQRHVKHV